jgi:hypothetical protein
MRRMTNLVSILLVLITLGWASGWRRSANERQLVFLARWSRETGDGRSIHNAFRSAGLAFTGAVISSSGLGNPARKKFAQDFVKR